MTVHFMFLRSNGRSTHSAIRENVKWFIYDAYSVIYPELKHNPGKQKTFHLFTIHICMFLARWWTYSLWIICGYLYLVKRFRILRNLLLFFKFQYYPYYYRPRYYLGLFCFCYCYTLLFIYLFIIPSNRDPLPHCISKTNNKITIKFLVHTQQCLTTCRRKNSVTFTDDLDPWPWPYHKCAFWAISQYLLGRTSPNFYTG